MSLLSMKLVEHIPGKSRVYKNALGFSTSIYRWENTKLIPNTNPANIRYEKLPFLGLMRRVDYNKVPTGTSYIQVIKNWKNIFLNSFDHGIHAPKK